MHDEVDGLINVLFDKSAREDERDDAAMDLGSYTENRVLNALAKIASDPNENDTILDSCGESIARILIKLGQFDKKFINDLAPTARIAAYSRIRGQKLEWLGNEVEE